MKNFWIRFLTQFGTYSIFLWGVGAGLAYTKYGISDMHTILALLAGTFTSIQYASYANDSFKGDSNNE